MSTVLCTYKKYDYIFTRLLAWKDCKREKMYFFFLHLAFGQDIWKTVQWVTDKTFWMTEVYLKLLLHSSSKTQKKVFKSDLNLWMPTWLVTTFLGPSGGKQNERRSEIQSSDWIWIDSTNYDYICILQLEQMLLN